MRKKPESTGLKWATRLALRFIATYIVLTIVLYWASPFVYRTMLPLWRLEINLLGRFELKSATLQKDARDQSLKLFVKIRRPLFIYNDKLVVEYKDTGLALGYLNCYPLIVFSLLLAWPGLSYRQKAKTAVAAAFLILFVFFIDPPLYIISTIEEYTKTNPVGTALSDQAFHYVMVYTYWVLTNGGRQILAVLIFAFCLLPHYISSINRNPPHA